MKKILSLAIAVIACLALGVTAFAAEYGSFQEFFSNSAVEVATIPFEDTVEPTQVHSFIEDGEVLYGYMYKVETTPDQILEISASATCATDWFRVCVYRLDSVDTTGYWRGTGTKGGTAVAYAGKETATYHILIERTDYKNFDGAVNVSIKAVTDVDESINLVDEPISQPQEGDLWSYDPAAKILTLEEGFSIFTYGSAIIVPDGTTVEVKGNASVNSMQLYGIISDRDITVNVAPGKTLTVTSVCDCGIVGHNITLNGKFDIFAEMDGLIALETVSISNSEVNIKTYDDDGIDACVDEVSTEGKIIITNSVVNIEADDYGMDSAESITLNGSKVYINTAFATGDEGTIAHKDIYITNCEITVEADDDCVDSDSSIFAENSKFNLKTERNDGFEVINLYLTDCEVNAEVGSDGIYAEGKVSFTRSKLNFKAGGCGIKDRTYYLEDGKSAGVEVNVSESELYIEAADDGISVDDGNIIIKDSKVKIKSGEEGIISYSDYYKNEKNDWVINISNSKTEIYSGDEGIQSDAEDTVNLTEGTLKIVSGEEAVEAGSVNMQNIRFDLLCEDPEFRVFSTENAFKLPGRFAVENAIGHLIYKGTWDSRLLVNYADEEYPLYTVAAENEVGMHIYSINEEAPVPCGHRFDENGKCQNCGIVVIKEEPAEKPEEETNPNTGAPVIAPAFFALVTLAGFAVNKKK